jgi:hypothetical protein
LLMTTSLTHCVWEGRPPPAALVAAPAATTRCVDEVIVPPAGEDVAVDGVDLVGAEGRAHVPRQRPVLTCREYERAGWREALASAWLMVRQGQSRGGYAMM